MDKSRTCQTCGAILTGRIDRKFCSDQCRATFNNRNKRPHELAIKQLNSQLRKNRTLLKTLCPLGKATVRKEVLSAMGFSFRHFTSMHGSYPKMYFICYDYAWMPIVEKAMGKGDFLQKVLIVQQQDFMRSFDPWLFLAEDRK